MKVYTRQGDQGQTGLRSGPRVSKDSPRLEAIGTLDELNSAIGCILAWDLEPGLKTVLEELQRLLFQLGADLADPKAPAGKALLERTSIARLEAWIDQFSEGLPDLRDFILPGGASPGAGLFWARALCRRAERRVLSLAKEESIADTVLPFLNRLGDLLFVMARRTNSESGREEKLWKRGA